MIAHRLTWLDELRVWWAVHGELGADVVTYYGVCSAFGAVQGWLIGQQIVGYLGRL